MFYKLPVPQEAPFFTSRLGPCLSRREPTAWRAGCGPGGWEGQGQQCADRPGKGLVFADGRAAPLHGVGSEHPEVALGGCCWFMASASEIHWVPTCQVSRC